MLCDGRPDPTSKKDINTYKNLWKEDSNFKSMTAVLNECELTLQVSFAWLFVIAVLSSISTTLHLTPFFQ